MEHLNKQTAGKKKKTLLIVAIVLAALLLIALRAIRRGPARRAKK